jgi:predicted AlkP superfamily phosphohydrolase/phosphomutase
MEPEGVVALDKASVDWSRTKAWGWGGYYARIFLNVEGRESEGVIPQGDYEQARAELAEELQAITHPDGRKMEVRVFRPEELYSTTFTGGRRGPSGTMVCTSPRTTPARTTRCTRWMASSSFSIPRNGTGRV